MWNFSEGLDWCCQANKILSKYNIHTALTGSVLFIGYSYKDLDIVMYPHKTSQSCLSIYEICDILNLKFKEERTQVHMKYNEGDEKKVFFVETYSGKRIDIFFLS